MVEKNHKIHPLYVRGPYHVNTDENGKQELPDTSQVLAEHVWYNEESNDFIITMNKSIKKRPNLVYFGKL